MLGFSLNQAKAAFFDRKAVVSSLTKAERRVYSRIGAYTRTTARQSIRPASKSLQRRITKLRRRLVFARKNNSRQVPRMEAELRLLQKQAVSKPGNPPKSVTGKLRKGIQFAFDQLTRSVVIGPVLYPNSTLAQKTLEFGGTTTIGPTPVQIEARPYMGPAKAKNEPRLPELWHDAMKQ